MLRTIILSTLGVVVCGVVSFPFFWQAQNSRKIDKTSPDGKYRVLIEFTELKATGSRDRDERLKMKYFKFDSVVTSYESLNSDQYEPSLADSIQRVEWLSNDILVISKKFGRDPFRDDLLLTNNTSQILKYVEVDYGRNQSFHVFDLAPGAHISLSASPDFKKDGSSNYFLGFGGESSDGRRFEGTREVKQRRSPADGPLSFDVTIRPMDLK